MNAKLKNAEFVSTQTAANLLGVSIRTVQVWLSKGVLSSCKTPGGHYRILGSEIDRLLFNQQNQLDESGETACITILVIEDEPVIRELYQYQIGQWDLPLNLKLAANGFSGLILAGECKPDIIFSDLIMPGMDGFQMLAALEKDKMLLHTDVVVVTAMSEAEIQARGSLPDYIDIVHKPIPFDVLEKKVQEKVKAIVGATLC